MQTQHAALIGGGVLVLFVLGLTAFGMIVRYEEALHSAERQTQAVALIVADSTHRALSAISLNLQAVMEIRGRSDDGHGTNPDVFHALNAVVKSSQSLSAVGWTDQRGNLKASSEKHETRRNLSDQPEFTAQLAADTGLFIGPALRSDVTGVFVSHVSRRIDAPDGAFAGIAMGTIDPLDLTRVFSSINLGRTQVLSIAFTSGAILSRVPPLDESVGRSILHGRLFTENMLATPTGSYRATFALDGRKRIVGYAQLKDFPLVVIASVEHDEALANWRIQATRWAIMVALVSIGLSVGIWVIYRQAAYQAEQSRALVIAHAHASEARTEAEKARDEAQAASRAKSAFLSNMSHELRTPLNAVLGFTQWLELNRERNLTAGQMDALGCIRTGGTHLLNLVTEILDLSTIEAGQFVLSFEDVSISEILQEALAVMEPIAAKRGVALSVARTIAGAVVHADPQRLRQVLLNLLSNAIKYNRAGGAVEISVHAVPGDRVRIVVADTGIGIPKGSADKVFAPFQRLGAERSAIEGTGIGLALTKRLIEAMGGTIAFSSEAGVGSKFWFDLATYRS